MYSSRESWYVEQGRHAAASWTFRNVYHSREKTDAPKYIIW